MTQRILRPALWLAVWLGALCGPVFAIAALPTPTQAILVVQDSGSPSKVQGYVPELLLTEGLPGYQTAQLGELTAGFVASYDIVILPSLALTATQASLFSTYVSQGGTLVGFRPDSKLASTFGVTAQGSSLTEGWLKIDTGTAFGAGSDSTTLRFHGTADAYTSATATVLATLYQTPQTPTAFPAVAINNFGTGKAVLFAYDLPQSIVLTRQGNPAWAGYPNNRDGYSTMRPSQMFMDQISGTFWNDLGDNTLNDVPQADIQLRLFSTIVTLTNATRRPLPRLWYFPNQAKAIVLMTGDQHGDDVANSTAVTNAVQSYGGTFQNYLWYPYGSVSQSTLNIWLAAGHGVGVHFDGTAEVDGSGVGGSAASWAGMQDVMSTALGALPGFYPTLPAPTSNRNHFLIWVSNDAAGNPDQTAQAKLFANFGIQIDHTYTAFPNRWGYMTGSGLPMKFLDLTTGAVIPVYQQATQFEDDVQLSGLSYSVGWDFGAATTQYRKSISDSATKYNTALTFLFHPDSWATYGSYAHDMMAFAQANNVPLVSSERWNTFWRARTATSVSKPTFAANTLSFSVNSAASGLSVAVPFASGSALASGVTVNGASQAFSVATLQGVASILISVGTGTQNVVVTYSASTAAISGSVLPASAAPTTSVLVTGGPGNSISQQVQPDANGAWSTTALPVGTYTVTPSSVTHTFNPTSASVTLSGSPVGNVNFTATPITLSSQTLFTTQVPQLVNLTDGASANYELGMLFRSSVAGQISAIRFWKTSNETGVHTGRIWSATGQLLASTTFVNETASGWQQQALPAPLSIAAGTTYVVSVNTGGTYYVATTNGLAAQVVNSPLSSVVGNNGVFGLAGQFPTNSWQSTNYFRDVVFESGAPPSNLAISGSVTPASNGSGTSLALTGSASATTTADAAGAYLFGSLGAGTYTVTPSKAGFVFSPPSITASLSGASASGVNFAATPATTPTYTITGAVTPASESSGVTLLLTGPATANVSPDAGGNYTIPNLPNGSYTVTPSKAGATFSPAQRSVTIASANVANVNFSVVSGGQTLFTTQTPQFVNLSDGPSTNYELGMLLTSSVGGHIAAIRYWKDASDSGVHTGRIWSGTGQLLASTTFTNETASGWQQQALATPLSITAGTTYVVSVNTANTYYVATNNGLATQIVNQALSSVVGNNGVFGLPGQFPNNSWQSSNYFRDVVFSPGASTAPFVVSGTVASLPPGQTATVTLSGAANGTTVTDAGGGYSFGGLPNGTYSVTPSKSGYAFTPGTQAAVVNGQNVGGVNFAAAPVVGPCTPPVTNPIACENSLPGNPRSEWDLPGRDAGDATIQGFANDISYNLGGTVSFKVDTTASSFAIDIYRLGYYGGLGARKVASIPSSATVATNQPNCLTEPSTGLIDCGNWAVSASWTIPANAVSGVYIAKLIRSDTAGASHVAFVVRNDASSGAVLFQASDTTWQAYNDYGGNNLYTGSPVGRAYKVSYNRPFSTRSYEHYSWIFNAEYPMIRWLEANGYNLSYTTDTDSDRRGELIRNHKVFLSVGHDEYWSGPQRANVEAARDAGVHLAFFSGNEVFWKTRWESSIDGAGT